VKDFEQVYSEYYDNVFQYVWSLCGDEQWAEEITQESFFKALKSIDSFRGECKLDVWLCQIAKNTYYTAVKRRQRQAPYPVELIRSDEAIDQKLLDAEAALQIHQLLHGLEEPYKEVFWMRTFGDLSFRKIGALFGKTESWARVTYHRAKMKIKEGLQ
jgi:RNA polymerase sigma-70 factor (ECF subfamily)